MRIYSPSKVIAIPAIILAAGIMYLYTEDSFTYLKLSYLILPLVILVTAIYIFHGQIDYWWHTKFPIKLDLRIIEWLRLRFPYYNELSDEDKAEFERRLNLYLEGRVFEFIGSKRHSVPEEMKAMVAAHGVLMSLHQKDFLIGDFDRIFLYKHPFGTPSKQFLHIVETEKEDGVLIFAMDYLLHGIEKPLQHYSIGFHGYAEAFVKQNPAKDYPDMTLISDQDLEAISQFPQPALLRTLGYPAMDNLYILITYFFVFPEKTKEILPSAYEKLKNIFGPQSLASL